MNPPRLARPLALVVVTAGSFFLAGSGRAADPVKWDVARTTTPESIEELKALEATVKKVVEKCSPATVGIIIGAGAGSGVIVSEDGLVLTAAHVSGDPGRDCLLVLPDGTRIKGKTLGTNDKKDSGMIKIVEEDPKKLPKGGKWPFIPVGKSGDLKRGQWVVSLGHPGGYKTGRTPVARLGQVQRTSPARDSLATNCTLVGGDSGGPLFDLNGNLVGIHSRISFLLTENVHVPTDSFKAEWDQLAKGEQVGKPKRAKAILGVSFDDDVAKIVEVEEGGPAAKAGIKVGDIVTKFEDTKVVTADNVRDLIYEKKPGDKVKLTIRRGGETLTIEVTLGKRS
jgi:serine protease Do